MKEKNITIIGANPIKNHWFDLWEKLNKSTCLQCKKEFIPEKDCIKNYCEDCLNEIDQEALYGDVGNYLEE